MKALVTISIIVLLAGCSTPTTWERAVFDALEAQDAPVIKEYNPGTAAALNVLPGFGDAYNDEWGGFAINLLLWPFSIVWGIPEAAVTAHNKNIKNTVYYYMMGPGKGFYDLDLISIEEIVKKEEERKRLAHEARKRNGRE